MRQEPLSFPGRRALPGVSTPQPPTALGGSAPPPSPWPWTRVTASFVPTHTQDQVNPPPPPRPTAALRAGALLPVPGLALVT